MRVDMSGRSVNTQHGQRRQYQSCKPRATESKYSGHSRETACQKAGPTAAGHGPFERCRQGRFARRRSRRRQQVATHAPLAESQLPALRFCVKLEARAFSPLPFTGCYFCRRPTSVNTASSGKSSSTLPLGELNAPVLTQSTDRVVINKSHEATAPDPGGSVTST